MDLSQVKEIFETSDKKLANRYLQAGWKLLVVSAMDDGDSRPSQSPRYSLGWTGGMLGTDKAVHPDPA